MKISGSEMSKPDGAEKLWVEHYNRTYKFIEVFICVDSLYSPETTAKYKRF